MVESSAPAVLSLEDALRRQAGVVSRSQLQALGLADSTVRSWLKRDWRSLFAGVYVHHSGPPTQRQLEWAAVLHAWPAALSHRSALPGLWLPGDPRPVHVATPNSQRRTMSKTVVVHEMLDFEGRVMWGAGPPRIEAPQALLDVLRDRRLDDAGMVAAMCDAIRIGLVSAVDVRRAMDGRLRVRARDWLRAVLCDLESGVDSVLEHRWHTLVEQPHGLPTPHRQDQTIDTVTGRVVRRDATWRAFGLVVELDGFQHHQGAQRQQDLQRDLAAAANEGLLTLRIGWRQVVGQPCQTAFQIASVLRQRGWSGSPQRCPRCPCSLRWL